MVDIIKTAGILIIEDDKVLLVEHGAGAKHLTGVYGLPAGRLNFGETEIGGAIRELYEETGLIADPNYLVRLPKTYIAEISRKDGAKTFSLVVYRCNNYSGELIRGNNETVPILVEVSSLRDLNLLPNIEEIVNDGLKF